MNDAHILRAAWDGIAVAVPGIAGEAGKGRVPPDTGERWRTVALPTCLTAALKCWLPDRKWIAAYLHLAGRRLAVCGGGGRSFLPVCGGLVEECLDHGVPLPTSSWLSGAGGKRKAPLHH